MKLSGAFDFFEEISVLQINQSELAMIGLGEYDISDSYKKYKFSPDVWNMMNSEARINAQNAFLKAACHHTDPGDFNITKAYRPKSKKETNILKKKKKKEVNAGMSKIKEEEEKELDALYEKENYWHQNEKRGQDERTANGYNLMGKLVEDKKRNLRSSKSEESRNKEINEDIDMKKYWKIKDESGQD